jgi:hypothetical protein
MNMKFWSAATRRRLAVLVAFFLSAIALATADAANDYNFRLIVPPLTGDVEQVQLDPSQWSVTLTNFPSGVRRGVLEFIGSGGGGGGAGTINVETNGTLSMTTSNLNLIGAGGTSITGTQNGTRVDITINTPTNSLADKALVSSTSNTLASAISGMASGTNAVTFAIWTNGTQAASGITTQNLIGAGGTSITATQNGTRVDITVNTPTNSLADKALVTSASNTLGNAINGVASGTNQTPLAAGFGETFSAANGTNYIAVDGTVIPMLGSNNTYSVGTTQAEDVVTGNAGMFSRGSLAGWTTNKSGFALIVFRGTDGSDTYNVDGTKVALVSSNNAFSATNSFSAPVYFTGGITVTNNGTVTGTWTAGTLSGNLNGANVVGTGSLGTNLLARVSNNSGTIGGAGNYLVVTFDPNTGLPISWTTATGPPAGASTNAVTFLENANNGNTYNNVNGIIFTNVPYFTQNQSTNTVGFSNVVFDTISLFQGGTNFVLHGATLSFTNATTQGGTISINNSGTIVVGGVISNLSASGLTGPGGLTYDHTSNNNGSGTGTLTQQAAGGDLDIQVTSNLTGQALYISEDTKTSFTFKHDTGSAAATKEFKCGLSTDVAATWEVTPSLGNVGFTWDFVPPHECYSLDLGIPWALGGYSSQSESANIIVDQMNIQSQDNHKWYPGNNTNFPALWVKAGGYQAASATGVVMNSDWINIGAASSTNGTIKAAFIGVASNEDFLAVWSSYGMSTNGSTVGTQYSTNSTDAKQFGTNRFGGILFGHNGTFGAPFTNVIAHVFRDETNGLQVVTASTNNGGSIWIGSTNNLLQDAIGPVYSGSSNLWWSISGNTTGAIYEGNWP